MSTPKVIYIGGHGRSGTTILDRVLAEVTGGFSAGEIHRFWAYGLARDWTCSCGERLRDCEFWGPVLKQSFSESGCSEADVLEAWQTVARPRSLLSLWFPPLRSARFQNHLSLYRVFLEVLYRNVSQRSGKRVIVDSSGSPLHGYILSGLDGVEVAMVHLVRDARAVAFSNQKQKPNPSTPEPNATMRTKPALSTAVTWTIYNCLLERLESEFDRCRFVKYEKIFDAPKSELENILDNIVLIKSLDNFISEKKVYLSTSHTGQGNPSRFNEGITELATDREWKNSTNFLDKSLILILCSFYMRRYNYL